MNARLLRNAALLWVASLLLVALAAASAGFAPTQVLKLLAVCALIGIFLWPAVLRLSAGRPAAQAAEARSAAGEAAGVAGAAGHDAPGVRRQREQQMLVERDALTGCLNREATLERLGRLVAQARDGAQPLSCALLAPDDFAALGARHGEELADRVLGLVAQLVRDSLRDVDLLGHWSGPGFCVVMPGIDAEAAVDCVERIRRSLAETADTRFTAGERVTLGAGIASLDATTATAEALVDRAAQALATTRAGGTGRTALWSAGRTETVTPALHDAIPDTSVDPLTGLPGVAVFRERIDQGVTEALRTQRTMAIALVSAFCQGRPPGADRDELRLQLSIRLRNALRAVDTVALVESDWPATAADPRSIALFGLLLNDLPDPRMAANIVRRVTSQASEPAPGGGPAQGVGLATGVALAPQDSTDTAMLVRSAGAALDIARTRAARISCEFATAEMNQVYVDQERFRAELEQALAGDELELHFLPRFELASGRVSGLEALVRWNHPVRGQLQPAQFIGTAETAGMIVPLGNWVLGRAIAEAARWREAGHPDLVVCVNLSPFQFRQLNLVELTAELLGRHGVAPHNLEIEIAESSVIRNTEPAIALINRLNRSGVRIAIDDFGTGYAVLKYLRRFPANTVKIDRSLVADVHTDNRDATIVSAIVALAGSLGIDTVAEGVETEAQSAALRSLGCRAAQGFLFSRPLGAGDVPAFLARSAR